MSDNGQLLADIHHRMLTVSGLTHENRNGMLDGEIGTFGEIEVLIDSMGTTIDEESRI